MRAGSLRFKAELQRYTPTQNSYGEEVKAWSKILDIYCDIKPIRSQERMVAQGLYTEATHTLYTRFIADIKPKDRILVKNRVFDIIGIINQQERDKALTITCKE